MKGLWKGFWDKVKDIRSRWEYGVAGLFSDDPVSEEFFEKLEEHLLAGDVGLELTESLLEDLRSFAKREKVGKASDLKQHFAQEIKDTLQRVPKMGEPLSFDGPLGVILMQENPTQLPLTAAESEFLGEACGMILTEHPNGLVSIHYYTSQEDLGSAWATLQSDYDTLINEDEMDA